MGAYLRRLGIETDVWLSVLTGGERGQTISLRVARAQQNGSRPACWVCAALSRLVERDHCTKTLAGETTAPDAMLRSGLLLAVAFALLMWGIPWLLTEVV